MTDDELELQQCRACGHRVFPERLACPRCCSADLIAEPAGPGVVVDCIEVRRAPSGPGAGHVRIVLVQLDAGPQLLARDDIGLDTGTHVSLKDVLGAVIAQGTT